MILKKQRLGDKSVMPLTIGSGMIATQPSSMKRLADLIPQLGFFTTKSIGPEPRPMAKGLGPEPGTSYREPIVTQYMPLGFLNAVGLTNPGCDEFRKELLAVGFPKDRFLLASVFGGTIDEFVRVVKTLDDVVDGFEENLSCPHVAGHGMALGQDPDMVYAFTRAVVDATKKPVFAKLTPNVPNIGAIALAARRGGAYGITAINTVGPGYWPDIDGHPILTNKIGGVSGRGILPLGLKAVRDIRNALPHDPIIAQAGIAIARDILAYGSAGATFWGLGTCCVGMTDAELVTYADTLESDLEFSTNKAERLLKTVSTEYTPVKIIEEIQHACDFKSVVTDGDLHAGPGQFVFAWIPGVGEKPFSIVENAPLTLGVQERGTFTKAFNALKKGDTFYIKGPYGRTVNPQGDVVVVGGGCGIAGVYLVAKQACINGKVTALLAAKDIHHIPYLKQFEQIADVHIATEDGSGQGAVKGLVTDLFKRVPIKLGSTFYNCGPKAMVNAVLPLELAISPKEQVLSSLDYMTSCGIGLCGKCVDPQGRRACVEGPYMQP